MSEKETIYWSRTPGRFVNSKTGEEMWKPDGSIPFQILWKGTSAEWNETLMDTIKSASPEDSRITINASNPKHSLLQKHFYFSNIVEDGSVPLDEIWVNDTTIKILD